MLDKFSLYWPYKTKAAENLSPLQGYAFRTAVLNGTLNRSDLRGLARGSIRTNPGTTFNAAQHGLILDSESLYEDCAYVKDDASESEEARMARIEKMVHAMEAAYGGGTLAPSFDPDERAEGVSALRSEWNLLKKHAGVRSQCRERR